eukprot:6206044-Pleurochrysis_carterae.AAC.2
MRPCTYTRERSTSGLECGLPSRPEPPATTHAEAQGHKVGKLTRTWHKKVREHACAAHADEHMQASTHASAKGMYLKVAACTQ